VIISANTKQMHIQNMLILQNVLIGISRTIIYLKEFRDEKYEYGVKVLFTKLALIYVKSR